MNGSPIICTELKKRIPSSVEGSHEGAPHVRVGEPEAVTQLVTRSHQEARPPGRVHRPVLVIVKVDISAVNREEGVGEGAAQSIKWVVITMSSSLKSTNKEKLQGKVTIF